jgi:hypothetical protein
VIRTSTSAPAAVLAPGSPPTSAHIASAISPGGCPTCRSSTAALIWCCARGEVRVFPLVAMGTTAPYPLLAELLAELRHHGIAAQVVDVG